METPAPKPRPAVAVAPGAPRRVTKVPIARRWVMTRRGLQFVGYGTVPRPVLVLSEKDPFYPIRITGLRRRPQPRLLVPNGS